MEIDGNRFSERLRKALGDESVNSFAKRCEIPEATMRNYFKGRFPTADVAIQLSDAAGVSFEWLIAERGPMRPLAQSQSQSQKQSQDTADSNDILPGFALVPQLDINASAGTGSLAIHEETIDLLAFSNAWLRSRNINAKAARVLTAKGDSMEPTIRDGDMLIVDTSITAVRDNAIYIVVYDGMVLVKRVNIRRDGSLILISDNERHAPEMVPHDEVPDLHIAGRVMWFGRSI